MNCAALPNAVPLCTEVDDLTSLKCTKCQGGTIYTKQDTTEICCLDGTTYKQEINANNCIDMEIAKTDCDYFDLEKYVCINCADGNYVDDGICCAYNNQNDGNGECEAYTVTDTLCKNSKIF